MEQHGIDPLLDQAADRGGLDVRDVERAGQRGEAIAAVGIGRFLEIIADQLELGVARARVDEVVEKLREGAHRAFNARTRLRVSKSSAGGRRARRGSSCDRACERLSSASSTCSRQDCIATRWPGSSASCAERRARLSSAARPLFGGKLADRVHAGVEVERREAGAGVADFGEAQADLRS